MSKTTSSGIKKLEALGRVSIPHSRPTVSPGDRRAVVAALTSGTLVGGPRLARFERELATYFGRRQAVAVTSGSAALHLALAGMGVGAGDQVALPSYGCVSLLQAVRRARAEPLLIDCDPATFCMEPDDLRRKLGSRLRAVVLVHTFGFPVRVEPFQLGPTVIEDAATAVGARRHRKPAGSEGGLAVCSFNATKMITTGGGGAVLADDPAFLASVLDLIDYDNRGDAAVRYNERLGEMGSALGISQLRRVQEFVERRRAIAEIYRSELDGAGLVLPPRKSGHEPSWHRFVVRVSGGSQWVRARLSRRGIASPRPVHQPLHWILGRGGFPGTETAHREALSLPIYPSLSDDEARYVAREVRSCLDRR